MKNKSKLNTILKLDIREYLISNQQSKIELQKKKSWNISYEKKKNVFQGNKIFRGII